LQELTRTGRLCPGECHRPSLNRADIGFRLKSLEEFVEARAGPVRQVTAGLQYFFPGENTRGIIDLIWNFVGRGDRKRHPGHHDEGELE